MTQEEVRSLFDYRDGRLYWRDSGSGRVIHSPAGNLTREGYRRIKYQGREYREHQLIWLYHNGELVRGLDHIDGRRDNNRVENLRRATGIQNQGNRRLNANNTSGGRGVVFIARRARYSATIRIGKSKLCLGYFNTLEEAKGCYDKTAREWFGEYYSEQAG